MTLATHVQYDTVSERSDSGDAATDSAGCRSDERRESAECMWESSGASGMLLHVQ